MKLLTVIGARPQFIKAAAVSRAISNRKEIAETLVHTGQHFDANMSDIFFDELDIPRPSHNLGISADSHGAMTGRMLEALERVMMTERPDWVLVYGDTNSTLAGALAATKLHIPLAHVEAGLRSFNKRMPEELNRRLTDHSADLLLAPTETAMKNLRNEGLLANNMHLVGDVMYDAALFYRDRSRRPHCFTELEVSEGDFVLATVHRAENTDDPARLRGIFQGLSQCNRSVVLPLHPRTRAKLIEYSIATSPNIHLIDPVGYLEMVWLQTHCAIVATDSGGVQKEAYFHGKPCVTLRDETEWLELVECKWNVLAGSSHERIANAISIAAAPKSHPYLYGEGNAAEKVIEKLT